MWKRALKGLGNATLEGAAQGAAQGVAQEVGPQLRVVVERVDEISQSVQKLVSGEDLKRIERKIDSVAGDVERLLILCDPDHPANK